MKKNKKKIILMSLIMVILAILDTIFEFNYGFQFHKSFRIEVHIPFSAKVEEIDTRCGNGDGEASARITLNNEQYKKMLKSIKKNKHWKRYPLPKELDGINSGERCGFDICIPQIENGYWFFLDRHSDSDNKYDYIEFKYERRASRNYTLAVLDPNTKKLYIYEHDT